MNSVLVYVGDDPDFVKEMGIMLQTQTKTNHRWSLVVLAEEPGVLSHVLSLHDVVGVVFDFTHHTSELSESFCHEIVLFKNLRGGRTIPLVGVFADKEQLKRLDHVFTLGVTFSHVKGADSAVFYKDLLWLARGTQDHLGQFATVKRIDLPYHLTCYAGMIDISSEDIWFDSDILPTSETKCRTAAFGELKPHGISLQNYYSNSCWHDGFFHGNLRLSYPGPWDIADETILSQDTLETWIASYDETSKEMRALVLTQNAAVIKSVLAHPIREQVRVACTDGHQELKQKLLAFKPDLMCLDLPEGSEPSEYIQIIKSAMQDDIDWKPYIVVYQCELATGVWRMELETDRVLSYPVSLDVEILDKMISVSGKKVTREKQAGHHRFLLNDPNRIIKLELPIIVTSLSEHEMTFFCQEEIPMFSVLALDLPVEVYMVVIPQFRQLSRGPQGFHYQAIIHGLSHEEEALLRQYVNSAIFEHPKEFGIRPTELVTLPEEVLVAKEEQNKDNHTPAIPLPSTGQQERRVIVGKSKL